MKVGPDTRSSSHHCTFGILIPTRGPAPVLDGPQCRLGMLVEQNEMTSVGLVGVFWFCFSSVWASVLVLMLVEQNEMAEIHPGTRVSFCFVS